MALFRHAHDGAVGADHGAGPAAHALLRLELDHAGLFVAHDSAGDAGFHARRLLALPALERHGPEPHQGSFLVHGADLDPVDGRRVLGYRGDQVLGLRMFDRAGQFAGTAADAALDAAENLFRGIRHTSLSGGRSLASSRA